MRHKELPQKYIESTMMNLLVSVDFNHTSASSYFDSTLTKVSADGDLVKVFAWYDNEWGFSCRMVDTAVAMMNVK